MTISVKVPGERGPRCHAAAGAGLAAEGVRPAAQPALGYPTVMLPGQPSTPGALFNGLSFGQQATRAIESSRVKPFIAIFPPLMISAATRHRMHQHSRRTAGRDVVVDQCSRSGDPSGSSRPVGCQVVSPGFQHGRLLRREAPAAQPGSVLGRCQHRWLLRVRDRPDDRRPLQGEREASGGELPLWLIKQPPQQQTNLLVASKLDTDTWETGTKYADSAKMVYRVRRHSRRGNVVARQRRSGLPDLRADSAQCLDWLNQVGAI